jgi:hypothetical protein
MGIHEGHFRQLLDFGQQMARARGDVSLIADAREGHSNPSAQQARPPDQSHSL